MCRLLQQMRNLAIHLPKTEQEADQRLLRVLKIAVIEKEWPISTVKRMLISQLRNLEGFEENIWPEFLSSLNQKE
jgi:hypothetical protein